MKKYLLIIFLLFHISCITASSINYSIFDNKVLVEIKINNASNIKYNLPYDYKVLQINKKHNLKENILFFSDVQNLSIKYITQTPIEKSTTKFFFIINNPLLKNISKVQLQLPEGAVLSKDYIVFPKNYELKTNGRNIMLSWKNLSDSKILVSYEIINNNFDLVPYLLFIFLIILIIIYALKRINKIKSKKIKKSKSKKISKKEQLKKLLTKNLLEDEKRIIEYLVDKKNNEAWTKEILKHVNISKVKLSRKLKSLSQKGLIKKIPFGNANLIRLRK